MSKFPTASKPLAQPSSRRFHVFETAGLVEESSQRSSNLAWFEHIRFACESAQSKFETKIFEGRSLSAVMPSVSRIEKVADSPCQGKELKVNSQVYDLMSSKPSDTRSVPLSVREAAVLEKTLRSNMESYNFQLWTITALFRFLGESGYFNLDDPLLDQFQRSFSRGTENVASGMASAIAFVTTKRRESFLSHMVPSVTEAQKRKLLSDPIFQQKDLFVPATLDAARHATRDVSLYKVAQSRPSTSSGMTQRRPFSSSSASRGRGQSSPLSTLQRSQASSSSRRFPPQKKSSDPPKKCGGFRRWESVPSPSIGGCLAHFWPAWGARGVDAWVVEVLREGYRILFSRRPPLSDQPLPMPSYTPSSIREQEFQDLLRKQAIEQAPQAPGFYSRLFVV